MWQFGVPNAPCGVESCLDPSKFVHVGVFLMHRVELKDVSLVGLENILPLFLMHRVELKEHMLDKLV